MKFIRRYKRKNIYFFFKAFMSFNIELGSFVFIFLNGKNEKAERKENNSFKKSYELEMT